MGIWGVDMVDLARPTSQSASLPGDDLQAGHAFAGGSLRRSCLSTDWVFVAYDEGTTLTGLRQAHKNLSLLGGGGVGFGVWDSERSGKIRRFGRGE